MRRFAPLAAAAAVLAACGSAEAPAPGPTAEAPAATGETRGFVVSVWRDEMPRDDPGECSEGFNVTEFEYYDDIDYVAVQAKFEAAAPDYIEPSPTRELYLRKVTEFFERSL